MRIDPYNIRVLEPAKVYGFFPESGYTESASGTMNFKVMTWLSLFLALCL